MANSKKICFITCVNDEDWYSEALLYMQHLHLPEGMQAEYRAIRGAVSMAAGYNEGMRQSEAQYKVYLHQDTLVVNPDFIEDLLKIFADKTVGVLGVIGCRSLPRSGIWWDGMRTYGRVLHACEAESVVDTICMQPKELFMEVESVDGLLLATQYDIPWREDLFTGWHFYDTSQCREFARRGYKVAVPRQKDFWCIHCPKEKPLAPSYKKYQRIFLKEYGKELHPEV
jgi:hypothetical protein